MIVQVCAFLWRFNSGLYVQCRELLGRMDGWMALALDSLLSSKYTLTHPSSSMTTYTMYCSCRAVRSKNNRLLFVKERKA